MNAPSSQIEKLTSLARESSSDKRRELLREITDVFMHDPGGHSETEIGHFDAIMCAVSKSVEMSMRQALAARLSEVPYAPHDVIAQLAADEIDVARPVLEQSSVLTDDDLINVAESRGSEHMQAISTRPDISETVTDVLVARGDDRVLETLVRNTGARLSRNSMTRIVARSEQVPALHGPLINRRDMPSDLLGSMYFFVSEKLKREIETRAESIDMATLDEKIQESWQAIQSDAEETVQQSLSSAERFVQEMIKARALNESLLVELLQSRRRMEFIYAFAALIEVDLPTAQRILNDPTCDSLAIAAKAARFDRSTFAKIIFILHKSDSNDSGAALKLVDVYDKITIQSAQRVMRFWRIRKNSAA